MKEIITYDDFAKLDLRVGRVIAASAPEWSQKLLQFTVDFGSEIGERTIMSGVKAWYEPDYFLNKSWIFIVNLAERKMGEGVSQGMMLMVDSGEKPLPFSAPEGSLPGMIIR